MLDDLLKQLTPTRVFAGIVLVVSAIGAFFMFGREHPWLSGAIVLTMAYPAYALIADTANPFRLALGSDNRYSLSKLQFLVWTLTIGFGVAMLLALKGFKIPEGAWKPSLFIALGFSSLTALSAKAVTTRQVERGEKSGAAGDPDFRQFLLDDQNRPDLTKFQMLFWTIVAIVAFLGQLRDMISSTTPELPVISDLFLVLMGLANGTYLGTKLVTTDTPRLTGLTPGEALIGTRVKVLGAALGPSQEGSQVLLGGTPISVADWKDGQVEFTVPRDRLGTLDVQLVVRGLTTNIVQLNVVPLRIDSLMPSPTRAGEIVDVSGVGFGELKTEVRVIIDTTEVVPGNVFPRTVRFTVPSVSSGQRNVRVKRGDELSGILPLQVN